MIRKKRRKRKSGSVENEDVIISPIKGFLGI